MAKVIMDCIFPKKLIKEPILYKLTMNQGVIPNILKADVTNQRGYLELELSGKKEKVDAAIKYLRSLDVSVKIK
ncbi:MAG TPA: NIL domain-containing protein [Candidatus Nanoarchaeia archaeon]|nr:NIL domain-containing protein [Candidatus Nanoarchaeia archaeon]